MRRVFSSESSLDTIRNMREKSLFVSHTSIRFLVGINFFWKNWVFGLSHFDVARIVRPQLSLGWRIFPSKIIPSRLKIRKK